MEYNKSNDNLENCNTNNYYNRRYDNNSNNFNFSFESYIINIILRGNDKIFIERFRRKL